MRLREPSTYFKERPECFIVFNFLLQSSLRRRQLADVRGVSRLELSRRVEEDIPDSRKSFAVLPLPSVHCLKQATVTFTQIEYFPKHFIDKFVDVASNEYCRICVSQRENENLAEMCEHLVRQSPARTRSLAYLFDEVQDSDVLLFLRNDLADKSRYLVLSSRSSR